MKSHSWKISETDVTVHSPGFGAIKNCCIHECERCKLTMATTPNGAHLILKNHHDDCDLILLKGIHEL